LAFHDAPQTDEQKLMTDTSVLLYINGLAGRIPAVDEFFKGFSNDYFVPVLACLVLVWLWFSSRDGVQREQNQRAIITAIISIGLASLIMAIVNHYYFRPRPFNELPEINLVYYPPHDSSFPANFTAVVFALAFPIFFKNKLYGSILIVLAVISSFGRIYMGVHYPLDILAGLAIGAAGSLLAYIASRVLAPLLNFVLDRMQRIYLA
jgi:undecaprenyl-diphosphatase